MLNWVAGAVLHTAILVPYQSWRISHRHHHQNTGHIDNDEIFYPHRKSESRTNVRAGAASLGLAWFMYLGWGFGPRYTYVRVAQRWFRSILACLVVVAAAADKLDVFFHCCVQHFNPFDKLFKEYRSETLVGVSVVLYMAWAALLVYMTSLYGLWVMVDMYFLPIFVAGSWLTVTTFLHHNERPSSAHGPWVLCDCVVPLMFLFPPASCLAYFPAFGRTCVPLSFLLVS